MLIHLVIIYLYHTNLFQQLKEKVYQHIFLRCRCAEKQLNNLPDYAYFTTAANELFHNKLRKSDL